MIGSFQEAASHLGYIGATANPHPFEALSDVVRCVDAIGQSSGAPTVAIVARHPHEGVPTEMTNLEPVRENNIAIISGGDGRHENPTEALALLLTLSNQLGDLSGARIALFGDTGSNATARSLQFGLAQLGATIEIRAPNVLTPNPYPHNVHVNVCSGVGPHGAAPDAIVVFPVPQAHFRDGVLPSEREYMRFFSVAEAVLGQRAGVPILLTSAEGDRSDMLIPIAPSLAGRAVHPSYADAVSARMASLCYCLQH